MRKQTNEIEEYTDFDDFLRSKKPKRKKIKIRLFDRITVSRWFRQRIAETYPALGDNEADWRMMQYLLFGAARDKDTKRLLLPHETLAAIAGYGGDLSHFKSGEFLENFRKRFFCPNTFTWTSPVAAEKCRQAERLIFPQAVVTALEAEYRREHYDAGRVYLATGRSFNRKTQRSDRRARQETAAAVGAVIAIQEARDIMEYLNNLPPHLFNRMVVLNHEEAEKVARSLPNETTRRQQLALLKNIYEQPQPFYEPSGKGKTARIFGGGSVTALKGVVRKAWTKGWAKADLKSSQLTINAMLWDVPEVKAFLRDGTRSIWTVLYEHRELKGEEAERAKPALKEAMYSLCYGRKARRIGSELTDGLEKAGIKRRGGRFTRHPLMKALIKGRDRAMEKILRDGGGYTCFGQWLSAMDHKDRTILALISQAVELKIMHVVFEIANKTKDFTITLFQHDGFAIHFTDKTKANMWIGKLSQAVEKEAQRMGILTYLEWEMSNGDDF
jgi:hypothetical protein